MSQKQTKIPRDLKVQILDRVKNSGKTIKEIASEHGISSVTIYAWLKEGAVGTTSREVMKLEKENRELKQIIGELTIQLGVGQKKGWR